MAFDPRPMGLKFEAAVLGGGAAGCLAAVRLGEMGHKVALIEKAYLERSGCLAAGVNALNAYVGQGKRPEDYADYAARDAHGIARRDLLLTMARRLNAQVDWLEGLGLGVHRDASGGRLERGWRNLRVNGENIKPLLAAAVRGTENVTVFERSVGTHLLVRDNRVHGLLALRADQGILFFETPAVIVTTGGAAGLYRPTNPGSAAGAVWYSPFNVGGGLSMGIRAGAEMTSLEMRFVALRCRDTMAPTGTLALGVGAEQVNAKGRPYEAEYGQTTSQRVLAARRETAAGRGPCHLSAEADESLRAELYRAYLNMCPSQTLKFLEREWALEKSAGQARGLAPGALGRDGFGDLAATLLWADESPRPWLGENLAYAISPGHVDPGSGQTGLGPEAPTAEKAKVGRLEVEIGASEPYVQGGHTAGGFWVDTDRRTTVAGLWAAGDAAGGCPQKYVTGSLAEAEIAAISVAKALAQGQLSGGDKMGAAEGDPTRPAARLAREAACELASRLAKGADPQGARQLEEALQKTMDLYAGGVGAGYRYGLAELGLAAEALGELIELGDGLTAPDGQSLARLWEVRDKLVVARSLVAHLAARKETRWPGFGEFSDFPETDGAFLCYVNSLFLGDRVETFTRPLVEEERYGHG